MKKNKDLVGNAILVLIVTLSVINIIQNIIGNFQITSIATSIIGIIGVIFFVKNKPTFRYLIWIWIFAQMIVIEKTIVPTDDLSIETILIFDCTQVLKYTFNFGLGSEDLQYSLGLNIFVFIYFLLFNKLKVNSYLGRSFPIILNHPSVQSLEPLSFTLTQKCSIDNNVNWILGSLNQDIPIDNKIYNKIIVYTEDGMISQHFYLLDNQQLDSTDYKSASLLKADWIRIP